MSRPLGLAAIAFGVLVATGVAYLLAQVGL
jgi:hypothetical protein